MAWKAPASQTRPGAMTETYTGGFDMADATPATESGLPTRLDRDPGYDYSHRYPEDDKCRYVFPLAQSWEQPDVDAEHGWSQRHRDVFCWRRPGHDGDCAGLYAHACIGCGCIDEHHEDCAVWKMTEGLKMWPRTVRSSRSAWWRWTPEV